MNLVFRIFVHLGMAFFVAYLVRKFTNGPYPFDNYLFLYVFTMIFIGSIYVLFSAYFYIQGRIKTGKGLLISGGILVFLPFLFTILIEQF